MQQTGPLQPGCEAMAKQAFRLKSQTEAGWRGLGALDQGVRTLFSTQREPRSIWSRGAIQSKLLSEAGFRVPIA